METPYEILGVEPDAGDEAIKNAYLAKVREHPPERDGDGFRRIRLAYEAIATEKQRLRQRLFQRDRPELAALLTTALRPGRPQRPEPAALLAALAECASRLGSPPQEGS